MQINAVTRWFMSKSNRVFYFLPRSINPKAHWEKKKKEIAPKWSYHKHVNLTLSLKNNIQPQRTKLFSKDQGLFREPRVNPCIMLSRQNNYYRSEITAVAKRGRTTFVSRLEVIDTPLLHISE